MSVVTRNSIKCDQKNSFFAKSVTKCVTKRIEKLQDVTTYIIRKDKVSPNGGIFLFVQWTLLIYGASTLIWTEN